MTPVLVDTSVWVAHFKSKSDELIGLLQHDLVLMHPFVLGEIACGTPPQRELVLGSLRELEFSNSATPDEVLRFIDENGLYGRGCGFVDLSLLASVKITSGIRFWTLDKRLAVLAEALGIAYEQKPPIH